MKINCHVDNQENEKLPNSNCKCNVPLLVYIPPGQHIHPCTIHPEFAVYSNNVIY